MEKALEILNSITNEDIWTLQQIRLEHEQLYKAIKEIEEAKKPKTCDTFDKGASSTNYPPKTIFAFGNYYTLKGTQC